ncbi:hypothetical protein RDM62_06480, partial [Stenotrophomonas maltophilia]
MNAVADLRRVAVYGATGSIGASTLDVIARHPQRYQATVLAAGRQVQALLALSWVIGNRIARPLKQATAVAEGI